VHVFDGDGDVDAETLEEGELEQECDIVKECVFVCVDEGEFDNDSVSDDVVDLELEMVCVWERDNKNVNE
jgi:hypothetical protein